MPSGPHSQLPAPAPREAAGASRPHRPSAPLGGGGAAREAIACLIVAVAALPLLSQRERHEWPGPAAPRRSSQTQRER